MNLFDQYVIFSKYPILSLVLHFIIFLYLSNSVLDVHRKTNKLHERPLPQQLPSHQTIDPYQYQQLTESIKSIRHDIANAPKPEPIKCPELPNCLTTFSGEFRRVNFLTSDKTNFLC